MVQGIAFQIFIDGDQCFARRVIRLQPAKLVYYIDEFLVLGIDIVQAGGKLIRPNNDWFAIVSADRFGFVRRVVIQGMQSNVSEHRS